MQRYLVPLLCGVSLVLQHPAGPLTSTRAFLLSLIVLGGGYLLSGSVVQLNLRKLNHPWMIFGFLTVTMFIFLRQWFELQGYANAVLVRSIFLLITFSLLALSSRSVQDSMSGLALSISVYVIINFVGAALGVSSDAIETTTAGTRAMGEGARLLVPFSLGLVSFPSIAAIGATASVLGVKLGFRDRNAPILALHAICGSVCLLAVALAEMRAALIVGVLLPFLLDGSGRGVKLGVLGVWAGMCALPLLYWNMWFVPFSEKLIPDFLHDTVSRYSNDILFLNGRAYIYDYGMALLGSRGFPAFGMGFDGRDSGPVLVSQLGLWESSAVGTYSFHNGFLELLIVNGALLGVAITAYLAFVMYQLCSDGLPFFRANTVTICYACIAAATLILNYMTAFVADPVFWSVLLYCLLSEQFQNNTAVGLHSSPQLARA